MEYKTLLTFTYHGSHFAVDVHATREILFLPELTPVEEAPPYIVGVFNLRGKIVPVMDIELCFRHEPPRYRTSDSVIIVHGEDVVRGIIANDVNDVITIPVSDIETAPAYEVKEGVHPHFLAGELKIDENIIMILDHNNLIRHVSKDALPHTQGDASQCVSTTTTHQTFCPDATPEERAIFHERARNLMHPPESLTLAGLLPIAVVGLSGEYFGVDLELVREFSDIYNLTPIPCCPEHIVGNMNLRGNIVTIVDIRNSLNMPVGGSSAWKKVVVAGIGELLLGVAVDSVFDVIHLRPSDISQAPSAVQKVSEKYIKGTAPYNNKIITILNLSKILSSEELVVNEEA